MEHKIGIWSCFAQYIFWLKWIINSNNLQEYLGVIHLVSTQKFSQN